MLTPPLYTSSSAEQYARGPSLAAFIDAIFDYSHLPDDERVCLCLNDNGWGAYPAMPRRMSRYRPGTGAWYFCVSTVAPPASNGYLARTHAALRYVYCMVLDDVGTKARTPHLDPSWVLESSPGNFQWGYLIDPLDMQDRHALAHYEACVRGVARAGLSDPGAQGAYRVMRVPGSLHSSGFVSRVVSWHPERCWALDGLMEGLGVAPAEHRVRHVRGPGLAPVALSDVRDPVLDWLQGQGLVRDSNGRFVFIECPWRHEHTSDSGPTSTAYSPAGYGGSAGRAFRCLHGHCADRDTSAFVEWAMGHGCPDPNTEPPGARVAPGLFDRYLHKTEKGKNDD